MERSFNENAKLIPTVFCFPFAGGSGYSYNGFKKCAKNVRIQPIEIPGRGKRIVENLISDIELIADDAFAQIRNNLGSPYAIYGHSMGSIIAYLTTVRIVDAALPKPMHVFVSGRGGPVMEERDLPAYDLPRHQFFSKLKEMGGSPTDLLDDPDDEALLDAANMIPGEKVHVVNVNNGERLETYIIKGERNTGTICMNGPAARKVAVGDIVIVISYAILDFEEAKTFTPTIIFPDGNNRI